MAIIGTLGGELNIVARHAHTVGPFTATWTSDAGVVINYTGATWTSVIRESWTGASVASFTLTTSTPTTGVFQFELSDSSCALLNEGQKYVYVITVTLGGKKRPLLFGTLDLRGS